MKGGNAMNTYKKLMFALLAVSVGTAQLCTSQTVEKKTLTLLPVNSGEQVFATATLKTLLGMMSWLSRAGFLTSSCK